MQPLRAAIDLPAAEDVEGLAIHDEDAGRPLGPVLAAAAERADIDAFRPAMDGVRPRVAGLLEDLLGLDDLVDLRLRRIRLGVDDINPRGPDTRDDQVAPLEEGVAGHRRQGRGAGVPAEMMELVAGIGHDHGVDDPAEARRAPLHVDHRERVGLGEVRAEQQGVGEGLRRSFHRQPRRGVEGRIGPHRHRHSSLCRCRGARRPRRAAARVPPCVHRAGKLLDASETPMCGGFPRPRRHGGRGARARISGWRPTCQRCGAAFCECWGGRQEPTPPCAAPAVAAQPLTPPPPSADALAAGTKKVLIYLTKEGAGRILGSLNGARTCLPTYKTRSSMTRMPPARL